MTPNHTDPETPALGKLLLVWISTITGMTITEWAAVFAVIYTVLQIVVLVRREFWPRKKP